MLFPPKEQPNYFPPWFYHLTVPSSVWALWPSPAVGEYSHPPQQYVSTLAVTSILVLRTVIFVFSNSSRCVVSHFYFNNHLMQVIFSLIRFVWRHNISKHWDCFKESRSRILDRKFDGNSYLDNMCRYFLPLVGRAGRGQKKMWAPHSTPPLHVICVHYCLQYCGKEFPLESTWFPQNDRWELIQCQTLPNVIKSSPAKT